MMNKPLVSIIIPVYKVPEKYLRQCLDSCVNQTLEDIEIIVVDDGSPDNCPKICDDYAEKDARVKVIHKENGGLVSARNAGFGVVQGEWHMYLDGDDWIDTNTCEELLITLRKYSDVDIVFWKCIQELGDKSIKGKWEWPCPDSEHLYSGKECIELARHTLVYKSGIATAYCKLINTEYAKRNEIYHDKRLRQGSEGLEFSLRSFYHAKNALFVNRYYNHYLYNPDSISKAINEKNTEYLTDCYTVIHDEIQMYERKEDFVKALYQRVSYVLIAIAMGTYFHPANTDSFWIKCKKYGDVIKKTPLFRTSINHCSTEGMGAARKLSLFCIRYRLYVGLAIIARAKMYLLKRGKFDY